MPPISDVKLLDCMEGMAAYPDKFFDLAVVDGGTIRIAENN